MIQPAIHEVFNLKSPANSNRETTKRKKIYHLIQKEMNTVNIPGFIMLGLLTLFTSKKERKTSLVFSVPGHRRRNTGPEYIGVLSRPEGTSRLYLSSYQYDSTQVYIRGTDHTIKAKSFRFETLPGGITLYADQGYSAPAQSAARFVYKPGKGKVEVNTNSCFEVVRMQ